MSETTTQHGKVTATSLNMRNQPSGDIVRTLPLDTTVKIIEDDNGWLKIKYDNRIGFVSKKYISETHPEESLLSPPPDDVRFRYVNKSEVTPDGATFGTKFRKGISNFEKKPA